MYYKYLKISRSWKSCSKSSNSLAFSLQYYPRCVSTVTNLPVYRILCLSSAKIGTVELLMIEQSAIRIFQPFSPYQPTVYDFSSILKRFIIYRNIFYNIIHRICSTDSVPFLSSTISYLLSVSVVIQFPIT